MKESGKNIINQLTNTVSRLVKYHIYNMVLTDQMSNQLKIAYKRKRL